MTILAKETDEDERVEAKVFESRPGRKPGLVVYALTGSVGTVCIIQCDLTESNLRQLKGYDDGISTSAAVYGPIEEAVYNTKYRDRIPYQK